MTILTQSTTGKRAQNGKADLRIRLVDWVMSAFERSRQRRALASLSTYQLRDIGLSRSDVADEVAKPFWRV